MEGNIRLGRFLGIPVGLHWSWFIIFVFITWSLVGMFTLVESPRLPVNQAWVAAVVTSVLFFASVLLHEFGHAITALRYKIPVRSISLFIFGGMAQIGQEPETPKAEFRIAIAGPLVSLLLAGLFWGVQLLFPDTTEIQRPAVWLARINLLLAAFNMIPGYPLDGGRVLRAVIWHFTDSSSRAQKIASMGGQVVAFCFIAYGIFSVITGNTLSGLWMAFIGWYMNSTVANTALPSHENPALARIMVSQVMEPMMRSVPKDMTVFELINTLFVPHGYDIFAVTENDVPVGILTIRNVAAVERADWQATTLGQIMVPIDQAAHVQSDTNIQSVLRTMDLRNLSHVTVRDGEKFTGLISRNQIQHYLRLRGELGV